MSNEPLTWEQIEEVNGLTDVVTERAKVTGGWLVRCGSRGFRDKEIAITFIPDQGHLWKVNTFAGN